VKALELMNTIEPREVDESDSVTVFGEEWETLRAMVKAQETQISWLKFQLEAIKKGS